MSEKTITIPLEEYLKLREDSEVLNKLECGGVDNWMWYGDSLDGFESDEFREELLKELESKINEN